MSFFSPSARISYRCPGHLHVTDPVVAAGRIDDYLIMGSEAVLDSISALIPHADAEMLGQLSLVSLMSGLSLHPDAGPADEAGRHASPK